MCFTADHDEDKDGTESSSAAVSSTKAPSATSARSSSSSPSSSQSSSVISSSTKPSSTLSSSSSQSSSSLSSSSSSSSSSSTVSSSSVHATSPPSSIIPSSASSRVITPTSAALSHSAVIASQSASDSTVSKSSGISGGAIGGIVAAVCLAILGAVLFFVRKSRIRRRRLRRNTWGAGDYPNLFNSKAQYQDEQYSHDNNGVAYSEKSPTGATPFTAEAHGQDWTEATRTSGDLAAAHVTITPPPMSYNNDLSHNVFADNGLRPPSPTSSMSMPVPVAPSKENMAVVRCVFIPSLPDELSITAGEVITVVTAYDDGWALCANSRGEQGMVPIECYNQASLASSPIGQAHNDIPTGDWRNSKRASSLHSGVATRF